MFDQTYAHEQLARRRNPVRAMVRRFYLANLLRHLQGPTIDIGCGAGQLLECLPEGSVGTEVNPFLVEALRERGLTVFRSSPNASSLLSEEVKQVACQRGIRCACLSHVLEHFGDAEQRLKTLVADCEELDIDTIVIVVPGFKGYQSDPTHRTFITLNWLRLRSSEYLWPYRVARSSYFPLNSRLAGDFFIYNELVVCLRRADRL
jgi:hypothetical protein